MSINIQKNELGSRGIVHSAVSMSLPVRKSACLLKIENRVYGNPVELGSTLGKSYFYARDKFFFKSSMAWVPYDGFQRIVDYFRENYRPKAGLTVLKLAQDLANHPDENRHPIQKLFLNLQMEIILPEAEQNAL